MIDRRTFLRSTAVSAVAALAPRTLLSAVAKQTPALPDLSQWDTVRAQFDMLSKDHVHFGSFYLVSHPRPVREAIEAYRRAIDAEPFLEVEHRMFMPGSDNLQMKVREDMTRYLGATPEQIALTGNTTTGLSGGSGGGNWG